MAACHGLLQLSLGWDKQSFKHDQLPWQLDFLPVMAIMRIQNPVTLDITKHVTLINGRTAQLEGKKLQLYKKFWLRLCGRLEIVSNF